VINTNLATRPFYNDTAVRAWIGVVTLAVVVFSVFNVVRLVSYSQNDTTLARQAAQDEEQAATLRRTADRLRASVNASQIDVASVEARQANELIDRRTFSWTELFNRFEETLPADVRITSVRQKTEDGVTHVYMSIVARNVDDIKQFIDNLSVSHAFTDLLVRDELVDDTTNQMTAALEGVYHPSTAPSADAAPAKPVKAQRGKR
jgi:hypothetical protein